VGLSPYLVVTHSYKSSLSPSSERARRYRRLCRSQAAQSSQALRLCSLLTHLRLCLRLYRPLRDVPPTFAHPSNPSRLPSCHLTHVSLPPSLPLKLCLLFYLRRHRPELSPHDHVHLLGIPSVSASSTEHEPATEPIDELRPGREQTRQRIEQPDQHPFFQIDAVQQLSEIARLLNIPSFIPTPSSPFSIFAVQRFFPHRQSHLSFHLFLSIHHVQRVFLFLSILYLPRISSIVNLLPYASFFSTSLRGSSSLSVIHARLAPPAPA
jgi:hypothetical protein